MVLMQACHPFFLLSCQTITKKMLQTENLPLPVSPSVSERFHTKKKKVSLCSGDIARRRIKMKKLSEAGASGCRRQPSSSTVSILYITPQKGAVHAKSESSNSVSPYSSYNSRSLTIASILLT